jgi:hypothetical protein
MMGGTFWASLSLPLPSELEAPAAEFCAIAVAASCLSVSAVDCWAAPAAGCLATGIDGGWGIALLRPFSVFESFGKEAY